MITPKYKSIKTKLFGNLTTKFGDRTRDENFHKGIDVANAAGSPVPSLEGGVVTEVGPTQNGLGNVVRTKDANGNTFQYAHLQKALVKPGMRIKNGQEIGKMGSSGNSYSLQGGDPSHTDVRIVNAFGKYMNPTKYLK